MSEGKEETETEATEEEKGEREERLKEREKTVFKGNLTLQRDTWKPLLTHAKRFLKEVTFRVNSDTITVQEMNEDRIAMLRGVIKTESLKEFGEKKEDKLFRVDLATFTNAVRRAGYPTTIRSDGAFIHFENSWGQYRMPLIDDTYGEQFPTPKIEYTVKTTLDFSKIADKLKWIHEKPDHITLIAKDGKLSFKAGNSVGERVEAEIGVSEGEGKASYPLEYLEVLKNRYRSDAWDIEFAPELPLHAETVKRADERNTLKMEFWVAPLVE